MSKIDLRDLLNRALAANSNQAIIEPIATAPEPTKPEAPRPIVRDTPRASPRAQPMRPNRALRPRRRS